MSKVARHLILQMSASNKWTPLVGNVKTAFLQGNNGEEERNVYGDPPPDCRRLFGMTPEELIQLTGSVYGLRTAPKAWFQVVESDLTKKLHFRQNQLDPCVFMLYDKGQLVGLVGVYVDDFWYQVTLEVPFGKALAGQIVHLGKVGNRKLHTLWSSV